MVYSIKYTESVPDGFGGITIMWMIRIRPKYMGDIGLLRHEMVHVHQFWRTLGLFPLRYLLSKAYRLKTELEAYREQLCWPPASNDKAAYREKYAKFLAEKYSLGITLEEARERLQV